MDGSIAIHPQLDGVSYALSFDPETGHGSFQPTPSAEALDRFYNGAFTRSATPPTPESEYRPALLDEFRWVLGQVEQYGLTGRLRFHDNGCGFGAGVWAMQQLGHNASGNEINRDWVERANPHCQGRLLTGSIEAVQPNLDPIDMMFCAHVLEHLADPMAALRAMAAALQPGGLLWMGLPNAASYQARRYGVEVTPAYDFPMHLQLFTPLSLLDHVARAGLEPLFLETRALMEPEGGPPLPLRLKAMEGNELFIIARKP
jgi:SAM-dependent methyltransferase